MKTQEYFTFACCRNPLDRFLSSFIYNFELAKDRENYHWKVYPKAYPILLRHNLNDIKITFRSFVLSDDFDRIFEKGWPVHFESQTHFLDPQVYKPLDFTARFENPHSDINYVLKSIGLPTTEDIPILNQSNDISFLKFYNDETRKRVTEKYREDFKNLGYEHDR